MDKGDRRQGRGSLPRLSEEELQEMASAIWAGYHADTAQPSYAILICWEASAHRHRGTLMSALASTKETGMCEEFVAGILC